MLAPSQRSAAIFGIGITTNVMRYTLGADSGSASSAGGSVRSRQCHISRSKDLFSVGLTVSDSRT